MKLFKTFCLVFLMFFSGFCKPTNTTDTTDTPNITIDTNLVMIASVDTNNLLQITLFSTSGSITEIATYFIKNYYDSTYMIYSSNGMVSFKIKEVRGFKYKIIPMYIFEKWIERMQNIEDHKLGL
jgi:hypothetical protein